MRTTNISFDGWKNTGWKKKKKSRMEEYHLLPEIEAGMIVELTGQFLGTDNVSEGF